MQRANIKKNYVIINKKEYVKSEYNNSSLT